MKTWHWTLILLAAVVVLMVVPFVFAGDSEFAGADGQAQEVITAASPDYKPWFSPFWEPNSETATMLFSLQAAIGAGLLAFGFGYWIGRAKGRKEGVQGTPGEGPQADTRLAAGGR